MSEIRRMPLRIQLYLNALDASMVSGSQPRLIADGEEAVGALLANLGVPATPRLELGAATEPNGDLRIVIDGRLLPYPWQVIGEARATLESGATQSEEATRRFLAAGVAAALLEQPEYLITDDIVTSFRDAAGEDIDLDRAVVRQVLEGLLACRISIADRHAIVAELVRGRAEGRSTLSMREALIARLRPLTLDVDLHPEYARRFMGGLGNTPVGSEQTTMSPESLESFRMLADGLFYELGIRIPAIRFRADASLPEDTFALWLNNGRCRPHAGLAPGMLLTNDTPERLALLGIHARPAVNPANGSECALIRFEDRELAVQVGLTTWDAVGHMILTAAGEIQRNAHCFIDQDVVEAAAWQLDEAFPGLASEVIEAEFLERSTAVMRSLLRDEVSIRDFRRIVEAIKTFDSVVADSPEQIVFDERIALHEGAPQAIDEMEILTAAARKALRRSLSRKYSRGGSVLLVFVLDPVTIEGRILDQLAGRGAMRDEDWELIGRELRRELEALPPARAHPAILTNATVAIYLRPKVTAAFPTLPILSYDEVAPEMNVQPMARISIG